ncbi:hypothetical protein B0T25DRAFT_221782 [Lasiosphaeria hispida]|uniref:Uncharacterized protein n=1 Tax=Lasiosphaeria hispida TaxID=260671 RepID=A0AAJ0HJS7_9PEZI|nr:hypothetical protein B0T25DRAFT_221782 [Lasiosphaeria hispida]
MSSASFKFGIPTPPSTNSSSSTRSRRLQPSSTAESSVGKFGIASLKFRVATPPRPRPLINFDNDEVCQPARALFGYEFEDKAVQLLVENGIDAERAIVKLTNRVFRDDAFDNQVTLYIAAKWTPSSPTTWLTVVESLKKYMDRRVTDTPGAEGLDFAVDMVAEELDRKKYLSLIRNEPKLEADWPVIKAKVFETLEGDDSTKGHMNAISLFRLGFDAVDVDLNPKTVFISLGYDSPENGWPDVLSQIQHLLDDFGHDLYAHMEHNVVFPCAFDLLPPQSTADRAAKVHGFNFNIWRPYKTAVDAGDDIGVATYLSRSDGELRDPMVGTLGCWVQVRVKDGLWKTMALTNYHVVRPGYDGFQLNPDPKSLTPADPGSVIGYPTSKSELWAADNDGTFPNHSNERRIEHPARVKHNFAMVELGKVMTVDPIDPSWQTLRDTNKAFFDSDAQVFGRVYLSSGYKQRTASGGRLDWALIEPYSESRIGRNTLPQKDDWLCKHYLPWQIPPYPTHGAQLGGWADTLRTALPGSGDLVFKVGASTTWTAGEFSRTKTDCSIREDKYMKQPKSEEYVYIGLKAQKDFVNFIDHGDSGAVVWDRQGDVVGLLFRGQVPDNGTTAYGLVMPIGDVFDSIKKHSGGRITDIRIAQFPPVSTGNSTALAS